MSDEDIFLDWIPDKSLSFEKEKLEESFMEIGDSKVKIQVKKNGQKDPTRKKYSLVILRVPVSSLDDFLWHINGVNVTVI